MMDCREVREVQDLYVDGELSPEAAVRAEAHLAQCPACRRAVDRLNRLRQAVKATTSQYQPPRELVERVWKSKLLPWRRPPAWVPALAGVVLILALGLFSPHGRGAVASTLEFAAFRLDGPRPVVMEGTLVCRDCQLKEAYGYRAMCPRKGHHGTLQTKDGKIWNILDGDASEDLIHNPKLLGRTVRIRGRLFRQADSVEVEGYELL